jgi:hypothetical protein
MSDGIENRFCGCSQGSVVVQRRWGALDRAAPSHGAEWIDAASIDGREVETTRAVI